MGAGIPVNNRAPRRPHPTFWVTTTLMAILGLPSFAARAQLTEVHTASGALSPRPEGRVAAFLGIPYAATTAGANRWRGPQPPKPWSKIRSATAFGADCPREPPYARPGGDPWTSEYLPHRPTNEACLFLNVWTPARSSADRLPVMVWIHGGGFSGGSASVPLYRGNSLAQRGIVVVSINYRLSVFGFLAHSWLTKESGTSGNYGLLDQIAALQWVKGNIAAFGGDPDEVTVAGQSAGAASVHGLIASPLARGLFQRAIAESGSGMGMPTPPLAQAETVGGDFARAVGARSLADLRAVPAAKFMEVIVASRSGESIAFGLTQDAVVLPDPRAIMSSVPVLTGLNTDEASIDPEWHTADPSGLAALFAHRFGGQAQAVAAAYGGATREPRSIARAVLRDRGIAAMLGWFNSRSADAPPVYAYLYTHLEPGTPAARFGVFHSAELPYVFGTLDVGHRPFTARDHDISKTLQAYWVNFVKTGNPNEDRLPKWPTLSSGQLMRLGDQFAAEAALPPEKIKAYDAYVQSGGHLGIL